MRKLHTRTTSAEKSSFTEEEQRYLGYYVYRLVDPRNGQTFYVGKGTGSRVFDHMKGLPPDEWTDNSDDEIPTEKTAKIATIKAIQHDGLSVTCFIHRHGMDEDVAYEVEAALIDAYGALTNIQKGHGWRTQGCMSIEQVAGKAKSPIANFKKGQYLIIKIRPETVEANGGDIYEAVRGSWVISPRLADGLPVLACVDGVIKQAFVHCKWRKARRSTGKARYRFSGEVSKEITSKFQGKLLPKEYHRRGQANPVLYVNCKNCIGRPRTI